MNFNLWLIICLVLITVAVIIVAVYLVITLIQVKKTSKEMELALCKINDELEVVNKVSDKVAGFAEKLSSPLVSAASIIFYILSGSRSKKNRCKEDENVQ